MHIDPAHWHLLFNHFPVILSITGTGFILAAFIFKKQHLKFGGLILLMVAAVGAFAAHRTGEGAEEIVEEMAGVSHEAIHNHEDIASTGLNIMLGTGVIALITILLVHAKKKSATIFLVVTLLASLASAGYMSYVGYTGGEIRHPEIRGDFGGNGTNNPDAGEQNEDVPGMDY